MQQRKENPDVRQGLLLPKLSLFLEKYSIDRDRDKKEELMLQMTKGYCSGLTTIWMLANWLEEQPNTGKARDDFSWFKEIRQQIISWDGKSELSTKQQNEFDRFLSLIEYYQRIGNYLPIRQGNLQESFSDTQNRSLHLLYPLGGLFTQKEAGEALQKLLDAGTFNNNFSLFGSHNHATGIFSKDGHYFFFDSNHAEGAVEITNGAELAEKLFSAYRFDINKPSPLGLRIFGFNPVAKIIPQEELIKNLTAVTVDKCIVQDVNYSHGTSNLQHAVDMGDINSTLFYLKNGADVNYSNTIIENNVPKIFTSAFTSSIINNKLDIFKLLLEEGQPIIKKEDFYYAVKHPSTEILKILFQKSDDVNVNALLKHAVELGNPEAVKVILSSANDKLVFNLDTFFLVKTAIEKGNVEVANSLLEGIKAKAITNLQIINLQQLLHLTARKDHPLSAKLLIKFGANINLTDNTGRTALHVAAQLGHYDTAIFLLGQKDIGVRFVTSNGETLINAALMGYAKAVKDKSPDIQKIEKLILHIATQTEVNWKNAYYYAIQIGDINQAEKLIELHSDLISDKNAIIIAATFGRVNIIEWLHKQGADINAAVPDTSSTKFSKTPLYAATSANQFEAVKTFIKLGANPNVFEETLISTPLYSAAQSGNQLLVKTLLAIENINPDLGNMSGDSPLHSAIAVNHYSIAQQLIDKGARVNAIDEDERTPLHYAVLKNNLEAVNFLLKNNADFYVKDKDQISPLDYAARRGWTPITNALIKHAMDTAHRHTEKLHFLLENGLEDLIYQSTDPTLFHSVTNNPNLLDDLYEKKNDKLLCFILKKIDSPLSLVIQRNYERLLPVLLSEIKLSAEELQELQRSALKSNKIDEAILLLQKEIQQYPHKKNSILHLAIERDYDHELLKKILEADTSLLNQLNENGDTPLHLAISHHATTTAEWLLSHDDINVNLARNTDGKTALHLACENKLNAVVPTLMTKCKDINLTTAQNETALYFACATQNEELVKLLLGKYDSESKSQARIGDHYRTLIKLAGNNLFIVDLLKVRQYLEYRSNQPEFTGWSLGSPKIRKIAAGVEVERMLLDKKINQKFVDEHETDVTKGKLGEIFNNLKSIK